MNPSATAFALPGDLFQKDLVEEISGATVLYSYMLALAGGYLPADTLDDADDEAQIRAENEKIRLLTTAEEVITALRKLYSRRNLLPLYQKAKSMQAEVMPLVIEKWRKTSNGAFAENCALLLSGAEDRFVEQVIREADRFLYPCAAAAACVLFAVRRKTETVETIYRIYQEMKLNAEAVAMGYTQGPLFALEKLS